MATDNPKIQVLVGVRKEESRRLIQKELNEIAKGLKFDLGLGSQAIEVKKAMEKVEKSTKKAKDEIKDYDKAVKGAGKSSKDLGSIIVDSAKKFALWTSISTVIFGTVSAIQDGVTRVKEFDDAMRELRKVSEGTEGDFKAIAQRAQEVGVELGRTNTEVINATANFARAGYEMKEAFKLGEQALLLTNIGDGIENATVASDDLIAVLKGFRFEASETAHIVDALNEVSNKYAVNTNDLTQGLRRASATLGDAGNTFEQTLGLITAGTEVLRNPGKVARGLSTITARLRGLNEAGEEMGGGFLPKLQDTFKSIAGVEIMKNGDLRSTYEVLTDLSKVWGTLTESERTYLAQQAAGKDQLNLFNALMINSSTFINATTDALNSQGSAMKENEIYLDSLSGRISLFTAQLNKLWNDTINSEGLKALVSLGTGLLKVADSVGLLNIALIALATTGFAKMGIYIPMVSSALQGFISAIGIATGVSATFISVLSGALVGVAIVGVIKGIDALITTTDEYNEKISTSQSNLEKLIQRKKELANSSEINTEMGQAENKILEKKIQLEEQELALLNKKKAKQSIEGYGGLHGTSETFLLESAIDDLKQYREAYKKLAEDTEAVVSVNGEYYSSTDELEKGILKTEKAILKYNESLKASLPYYEGNKEGISALIKESDELLDIQTDGMARWGAYTEAVKKSMIANSEMKAGQEEAVDALETLIKTGTDFATVLQSINDGQIISGETLLGLIEKYPQLALQISTLNNLEIDRKKILETIFEANKKNAIAELSQKMALIIAQEKLNDTYRSSILLAAENIGHGSASSKAAYLATFTSGDTKQALNEISAQMKVIQGLTLDTFASSTVKSAYKDANKAQKDLAKTAKELAEEQKKLNEEAKKRQVEILENSIKLINEENEALQKQADILEEKVKKELEDRKKSLENEIKAQHQAIDDEIDAINEKKEAQKDANEALEEEKRLKDKIAELDKAKERRDNILKEKNTRIFRAGQGFVYEADPEKLKEVNDEIIDLEKEKANILLENEKSASERATDARIRNLEREKDRISSTYNALIEEVDTLISKMSTVTETELNKQNSLWDTFVLQNSKTLGSFKNSIVETIALIQSLNNQSIGNTGVTSSMQAQIDRVSGNTPTSGFGTKPSSASATYYSDLKSATGGNQKLMTDAEIARTNSVIAERSKQNLDISSQKAYLERLQQGKVTFHDGGMVGSNRSFADMFGLKSDEMMIKAQIGEGIIPKDIMSSFMKGMSPNFSGGGGDIVIQNMTVKSDSANDFMQQMQQIYNNSPLRQRK